jgi:NTE family protein
MVGGVPDPARRTVAAVFGGGGARGLAHVGVLRALEERNCSIDAIAGCSVGGIIGAMHGSGLSSADIVHIIEGIRVHELLDFGARGGLIGGKGIRRLLESHVRPTFEDLDCPLKVTAVDVQQGALVVLGSGELVPALQATSALPGILSPVEHRGRILIDGGLLNNLPIDVARTMSLSPILAVDVGVPPDRHLDFEEKRGLLATIKQLGRREFRNLTVELFMKSFDIPQRVLTDMRLAMAPPEILIRPELRVDFGVEDMHRWEEAVELGYRATHSALEHSLG